MTAVDWLEAEFAEEPLAWPSFLPDHLSASQLGMTCAEAYRRRYVLGEKTPPGAALIWGRSDHAAHEVNFVQKIESGEDLEVGDVQEAFAEAFDTFSDDDVDWGDDKPGDLKDAGVSLVSLYHRQVSPTLQPLAVEQEFSLDVPGVPVPVVGRVDLRLADHVRERKTAKSKPSGIARHRLQGMIYEAALGLPIEWDYSVKTKTPAVYTSADIPGLRIEGTGGIAAKYVASLAGQLAALAERFGPDETWPGALSHDWACSYCGWGPNGNKACAWWQS